MRTLSVMLLVGVAVVATACAAERAEADALRDLDLATAAYEAVVRDAFGDDAVGQWQRWEPTIGCDLFL